MLLADVVSFQLYNGQIGQLKNGEPNQVCARTVSHVQGCMLISATYVQAACAKVTGIAYESVGKAFSMCSVVILMFLCVCVFGHQD